MKNSQRSSNRLILVTIISLAIISLGTYYFFNSKTNSTSRTYENKKFGYQITLPVNWTLPKQANAYIDLSKKYLTDEVNKEIFEEVDQDSRIVVKDQIKLNVIENNIKNESQAWDPTSGEYIIFTNATLQEQSSFYDEVNKKQKLILTDFFPDRTIRIFPSDLKVNFVSTTTSQRVSKTITLDGVQANYSKLTGTHFDHMIVGIPFSSDKLTYNGKKINSLMVGYLGNKITESEFLMLVSSFKFVR